jgi:cell division protein FtsL
MRRSRSGRSGAALGVLVLGFAGLLSALSLVTWRQSRAFEALAELDQLEKSLSLADSERTELDRRIQGLSSLSRISSFAQEQLGMHHPEASEEASEIVWLRGAAQ